MSEKKVGKRLLTWVLVLVMTLSLLPLNVLADEIPEPDNTPGKVTATKSCTKEPDSNGNYTITLTVQGNPVPSTDTMTTPANADVVLVVDNSGSMETSVGTPCEAQRNSFTPEDKTFLGTGAIVHTCKKCGAKYYEWKFFGFSLSEVPEVCTGQVGKISRINAAKNVSKAFASSILSSAGNRVAVIGFSHGSEKGGADENAIKVSQELTRNPADVENAINKMEADGGTNYTAALQQAYDYLNNRSVKEGRPGYVIFISDGAPGLSGESQNDPNWNGSNQATGIKRAGYTLYTVGIALGSDAAAYLKGMASDDQNKHFINVEGTNYEAQLKDTLLQWADKIKETPTTKPAGTGAVLTDVINTKQFEYVEGSAPTGLTVGEDSEGNKTVTWNIGEIPEKDASVSFMIKAKDGVWGDGIHTNENVTLTYTDDKNKLATMGKDVIGDPTVNIPAPQVTLTFDANGGAWESAVTGYTMGTDNKTASVTGEVGTLTLQKIGTDPVNAGHDFTGWYQDPECTTPVLWTSPIAGAGQEGKPLYGNKVLYAGWTPCQADTFSCKIVQHFIDADGKSSNIDKFTSNAIAKDTLISDLIAAYASNQTWDEQNYWYDKSQTTVNGNPITDSQTLTEDTVIDLYYYLDIWNDENDTISGGDDIPDMYQVLVKFESANPLYGTVEGKTTQVFTWKDTEGKYVTPFDVTPDMTGITPTPTAPQYKFLKWTRDGNDVDPSKTIKDVLGGSTIVFQAQWDTNKYSYTVQYFYDGTPSPFDSVEIPNVTYNTSVTSVNDSSKLAEGYVRDHTEGLPATITDNSTVIAVYYKIRSDLKYTVNYLWNNSAIQSPTTGEANYGDIIRINTDISGYTIKPNQDIEYSIKTDERVINLYYRKNVELTANSGTVTYDGTKHTVTGYTGAPDGANFDNVSASGSGTAVGDYAVKFNESPIGKFATVGAKEYIITKATDGKLTIKGVPYYPPYYPPVPPTVKIEDDDALGLNTTDHFAYIVGYGNGEVRPQNNITRAEVATIFFRLLTDDVRDENLTKTNRYSDVAATSWYNTAVSTLSSMGIITGYPDGTFRPNAAITRAEFAAIAARFDNDGDKTAAKFSDIATHWAKDEISIAYNNGWITGYPDGTFGPQRDITRAETMTLVNRVLNRQPETEDDLLPNMTVWTDNANPNAWYYLAVQEATNSHYYKFKTNSKYEKWTELRETRDWTQLEK